MNCPHCGTASSAKVLESRKHEGQVYRRRYCSPGCRQYFVTVEAGAVGLTMPPRSRPGKLVKEKPKTTFNSGAHLAGVWR